MVEKRSASILHKKENAAKRKNSSHNGNSCLLSTTSDPEYNDVASPQTISAYGIWVSEIMLRQTRVGAVIPYYVVPTSKSKKSKSTALAEPRRNAAAAAMAEESFIVVGS